MGALRWLALGAVLALNPCGDGGDDDPPLSDQRVADRGPCDGGGYPCGPFGGSTGEVAADATFSAFADADHLCKANSAMKMDLSALRPVTLSGWHRGGAACPQKRRRLLWLSVSAGWCGACTNEVNKLQGWYTSGRLDPRVAVMDVLLETKSKGQAADADFLKLWVNAYKLTFPAALDSSDAIKAYFSKSDLPATLLLDLQTMKIVYKATGSQAELVEEAIKKHLN